MDYKQAVKTITKFPSISEGKINNWGEGRVLGSYSEGDYRGKQYSFAFFDIEGKDKVILLHPPEGCRENLYSNVPGDIYPYKFPAGHDKKEYFSRNFFILGMFTKIENKYTYNKLVKDIKKRIRDINNIESKIFKGKKTELLLSNKDYCIKEYKSSWIPTTDRYKTVEKPVKTVGAIMIIPSEWVYNSVLFSMFTLLAREGINKYANDKTAITLLKHKAQIFRGFKSFYTYSGTRGIKYLMDKDIYKEGAVTIPKKRLEYYMENDK